MKISLVLMLLLASQFGYAQSTCIDFSNYDNTYLIDVTNDDAAYPIGSAFISSGDLSLIKYDNSFYQFIDTSLNQMCYIGELGIDVASAPYSCRTLTFNLIAGTSIIVDGVSNAVAAGASYSNPNWDLTMSSGSPMLVTISGEFDFVSINLSTICISNICLESCSSSQNCIDFSNYDNAYLNDVTNDDAAYPVGSAFISSGDLSLIKYDNSFYQFIDTSLNQMCYIGELGIDVASAPYSCRTLTFNLIAGTSIIVDGVSNAVAAGASYSNPNWDLTMSSGSPMLVTISGEFDFVSINLSTICISNICLESCDSIVGLQEDFDMVESVVEIYPNPMNDQFRIQTELENYSLSIIDLRGNIVAKSINLTGDIEYSVSELSSGVYVIFIELQDGRVMAKRMIKND